MEKTPDWLLQGATPVEPVNKTPDWLSQGATPVGEDTPEQDGNVSRGFKTAMRQVPQTFGGAAALAGDAVGSKGLRDWGMDVYNSQEQKIQELSRENDSFTKAISGDGNLKDWVGYGAGYVGGQALQAAATGGAGAFVGKKVTEIAAKKVVKEGIERGIAKEVADKAASEMVSKGLKRGAATGAYASNLMQEAGSIYPEALATAKEEGRLQDDGGLSGSDLVRAGGAAVGAAALDTLMQAKMLKGVMGGGGATDANILKRIAKEAGKGAGREALTEGAQTGIERWGAQQSLGDKEAVTDYIDSAAMGALGGAIGGAGAGVRRPDGATGAQQESPVSAETTTAVPAAAPEQTDTMQPAAAQPPQAEVVQPALSAETFSDPQQAEQLTQAASAPKPSESMGLDPLHGPMSAAAAQAVDSGATGQMQEAASMAQAAAEAQADSKSGKKSRAAQVADQETGEVSSGFANWTTDELRAQFNNAQAPNIRSALAAEIQARRNQELQAELDQENALSDADGIPDNAFASISSITDESLGDNAQPEPKQKTPQQLTTKGAANGNQTQETQQTGAGQSQGRGAQAVQPTEGLANASASTENNGAQATQTNSPQGKAPRATPAQLTEAQSRWQRMPTAERQAVASRTDVKPVIRKNLHGAKWENLNANVQLKLASAMVLEPAQPSDMKAFKPETGTLGVPRSEMPQIRSASHGGLVRHLNSRGIAHEITIVNAADLKPTQTEYSPAKVEQAKESTGNRAVIVSNDGHIIDGHHQAIAAAEDGKQVKAIVLDAPVEHALEAVKTSPSAAVQASESNLMKAVKDSRKPELVNVGDKPAETNAASVQPESKPKNLKEAIERVRAKKAAEKNAAAAKANETQGAAQPEALAKPKSLKEGIERIRQQKAAEKAQALKQNEKPIWERIGINASTVKNDNSPSPKSQSDDISVTPQAEDAKPARPAKWRSDKIHAMMAAKSLGIKIAKGDSTLDIVRAIDAHDAKANGQDVAEATKPAKEIPLSVGAMPNTAEPVSVKNGVVYIGKYEALDFDSGDPVTVPKGSTREQVAKALKDAGVLTSKQRLFGLGELANDLMFSRADDSRMVKAEAKMGEVRESIKKAYGKLLERLEAKGLVTVTHTKGEAFEAASKARADKLGGDWREIAKSMRGSVKNSLSPMKSVQANIRRGQDALAKALNEKATVHRAMFRNGLGWVDFVWGDEGIVKSSGKTKGAMGLAHIAEARGRKDGMSEVDISRLLDRLVFAIADGREMRRNVFGDTERVIIARDGVEATLVKAKGNNAWLLSGWEMKNPDELSAANVATESTLSKPTTSQLEKVAGFDVIVGDDDLDVKLSSDGRVEGFFDRKTGKSFLIADTLTAKTAPATLMHEVGIHMAADSSMKSLFARAENLLDNEPGEFLDRVRDRMLAAGEISAEESAAYIVTEYEKDRTSAPKSVEQFIKDFMAAVRGWLFRNGFTQVVKAGNLTVADIAAIARANARSLANKTPSRTMGDGQQFNNGSFDGTNPNSRYSRNADTEFAAEIANILAEHDETFRYPVSQADTLDGVMSEAMPGAQFMGDATREDERQETGADTRSMFKSPNDKPFYVYEKGREVWIDVSRLSEGDQGSAIYHAVANYAYNTGKRFVGDPAGLSEDAVVRRTAAMLSSALRFGTTRHFEAAPEQLKGVPAKGISALEWGGKDYENVQSLIRTFVETLQAQFPAIKNYRYDFATSQFIAKDGRPVGRERFLRGASSSAGSASRAGEASLRRGVFLQSLMASESSQRPAILEQFFRRSAQLATTGQLDRLFSTAESTAAKPAQNPSSAQGVWSAIEGVFSGMDGLRQRLEKGTTVVQSADDLPANLRQDAQDAKAQALFDSASNRVYMIADRIEAGQEKAVWLHEVFHKRGKELLGDVLPRLHSTAQKWATRPVGSVERQIYDAAHARAKADGNYEAEFLPYAIEEAVSRGVEPDRKANITNASYWLARVREALASAISKLTGSEVARSSLTGQDLVAVAYGAAGLEVSGRDATKFTKGVASKALNSEAEFLRGNRAQEEFAAKWREAPDMPEFLSEKAAGGERAWVRDTADKLGAYFGVDVVHSGSQVGPSSYLYLPNGLGEVRVSKHGKGAFNSQFYFAVQDEADAKSLTARIAKELSRGAGSGETGLQFSRARVQSIKQSAMDQLDRVLSHPGKVSLWDKTVGTMRHLAERESSFKPVFETAQGFIDDVAMLASDVADYAPRLLPRVESLGDIFGKERKKTISAQDSKAVAAPLFQGTLNWGRDVDGKPTQVADLKEKYEGKSADDKAQMMLKMGQLDPEILKMWQGMQAEQYEKAIASRFENTFLKGGVVWNDAELVEHFKATPQQISLYREARATIDRSIDMTARADMLRLLGEDYEPLRDIVLDAPSLDQATALMLDTLEEDAKADFDSRDRLADLMHGVRQRQERASDLMKAGYAPLSRFGKYTVDVVDADGKREYFGMFESIKESNAMFADMKKAFPNAKVTQGTISQEEFKLFAGVTPESLELFGNMLGLEGDGNEARDKAFQKYLSLSKNNHSALKRLIHRNGIAGYSEDVGRVLASFVYSNARQAAGGLSAGKLERAISEIPKGKGELRDVAMGLRSYIQDPQEEGQAIRGMLFAQYLGGSVASAFVNMTQPFAVTMPYLSQFGGMAQSSAQLANALKDMANKGFKYETDLANAMQHAEDDGIVSPQEIHQLMGQARGAGGLRVGDGTKLGDAKATASNNWEKLKVLWGQPFALAEQFNRRSTFIAAFRIAKEQGMANPAEFARKAVLDTQFLFSKANKPKWARGAVGGTLFTFKSYSVSYLELLQRTWNAGSPGSTERKAGRRAVAWSMAMLMMMGGAGGLPFMEDLEDLIDGIAQIMGFNFSTKQARKEFLREYLGKEFAEFMEDGVSGMPGAPIDVSGRLGMGNLIPGTGLALNKQNRERDLLEVLGPAGDLVSRGFKGTRKLLTGDVSGAALEVSPTAVRNAVKGLDMAASGMYKDTKGYKVMDTTLDEAVGKFLGFQPRSVAEDSEATSYKLRTKSFYTQTSSDIKAQWADAVFRKDDAALQQVRARLATWNKDNPDLPIVVKIPDIMKRVREMGKDRTRRIADTAPKALRAQMRDMAKEATS